MKILLIGNYYYPEHIGGVEIVSFNLVKHYRALGHEVRWVAADVPPKRRSVQEGDVPIRSWNIAEARLGFPSPFPYPGVWSKLYDNIRWCDVVHLQDCLYSINILAFFIAKLLRKPILITQYAKTIPYPQAYKRALQRLGYQTFGRLMFRGADRLVFITANVRDGMRHINRRARYEVVPLGVDTDFYAPISEEQRVKARTRIAGDPSVPLILFVGRMVERKGVGLLRSLIEKHADWHWVLVGRPDDYKPADWKMQNLTYFEHVSENELRDLYASADLLLHPSKGEGFTLTAAECVACGTPVAISEELLFEIDEQVRGLFLALRPEMPSIESVLLRGLNDMDALNTRRAHLRTYALTRFSWKSVTDVYVKILNEVVYGKKC